MREAHAARSGVGRRAPGLAPAGDRPILTRMAVLQDAIELFGIVPVALLGLGLATVAGFALVLSGLAQD